jgi:hypothetical protein
LVGFDLAWAQQCSGGGISLFIDPSVRSAGMGGASTAVFQGGDPNYWANPALLGYHRGIRYESSETQLVPELTDGVFFRTDRFRLSAWGVGLALNTWPGDQGPIELDYGESIVTDEFGNPIGTAHSYEHVESWGIGLNLVEFYENLAAPDVGTWSRYGDVSLGYSRKSVLVNFAPENVLGGNSATATTDTDDIGILVRVTPYNTIDHASDSMPVGLRADVGWGGSIQNVLDEELRFAPGEFADPILRDTRWGLYVAGAVGFPHGFAPGASYPTWFTDWILPSISPLIEVGASWDFSTLTTPEGGADQDCREIHTWGLEVTMLRIFSFRRGSIDDAAGGIDGSTEGWGIGLRLADLGGFRIDRATVPQAVDLGSIDREGFTVWVDPLAIARVFRRP